MVLREPESPRVRLAKAALKEALRSIVDSLSMLEVVACAATCICQLLDGGTLPDLPKSGRVQGGGIGGGREDRPGVVVAETLSQFPE
jgi:hypothetical protein